MNTLRIDAAVSRTAPLAGVNAPSWLKHAAGALQRALVASGQARARRQLLEFADRCESLQPTLANELRAASAHIS